MLLGPFWVRPFLLRVVAGERVIGPVWNPELESRSPAHSIATVCHAHSPSIERVIGTALLKLWIEACCHLFFHSKIKCAPAHTFAAYFLAFVWRFFFFNSICWLLEVMCCYQHKEVIKILTGNNLQQNRKEKTKKKKKGECEQNKSWRNNGGTNHRPTSIFSSVHSFIL